MILDLSIEDHEGIMCYGRKICCRGLPSYSFVREAGFIHPCRNMMNGFIPSFYVSKISPVVFDKLDYNTLQVLF